MGERTEEIESRMREERAELRANLGELGDRVRSVTDWRRQFRSNPLLGAGLAFGGGLLLASLLRGPPRTARPARAARFHEAGAAAAAGGTASGGAQVVSAWKTIQSALIGVVATKITDALIELIPGFREQLEKGAPAEERQRRGNGHRVHAAGNPRAANERRSRPRSS